jgi:hypothetical protein
VLTTARASCSLHCTTTDPVIFVAVGGELDRAPLPSSVVACDHVDFVAWWPRVRVPGRRARVDYLPLARGRA